VLICLLLVLVAVSLPAFAFPVRLSSQNGQGNSVDQWSVLGRTVSIPLTANGKKVTVTRQIICSENGDRTDGSCGSGNYIYLFQLQSTSANVTVNIGKLVKGTFTGSFFGINICDDDPESGNNEELCTEDPNQTGLSGIVVKTISTTSVSFTIQGAFPSFPAGTPEEGQGVTFYIQTHQTSPLPVALPSIGIQ
jgi:FlaG/FlaF family flagellin (archaellin)